MSMTQTNMPRPDDDRQTHRQLVDLVELTTYQLHRNKLITGSAAVEIGVVGFLTGAVIFDMLFPMPVALRVITWGLFWCVLLATLIYGVIWPTIRRPKPAEVALRMERTIGGMHNRLLTLLDLESRPADDPPKPVFVHRLIQQTRQKLTGYRIEHVADPTRMRRAVMIVAATLIVVMAMTLLSWDRLPTAMMRLMMPTANIPPVTWLQIQAPGDMEVLHGDPAMIVGQITRGQTDAMTLHLRDAEGVWTHYPMQPDTTPGPPGSDGAFMFRVNQVTSPFTYYLSAGRTWTPTYRISAVPRPLIEHVKLAIELPAYMKLSQRRTVSEDATLVEAPVGSTIHVESQVTGDVMRGELLLFEPQAVTEHQVVDTETVWFEDELPADATPQGRWRWSTARAYSGVRSFAFGWDREAFGFSTRLYPLTTPGDAHVFVYVWLDAQQPPNRLTLWWRTEDRRYGLTWGRRAGVTLDSKDRLEYAGPMPDVGRWVRLEAPVQKLTGARRAFKFEGMDYEIDTGRVTLDRPGFFERDERDVDTVKLTPTGRSSMGYLADRGVWTGQIPVAKDVHYSLRFYNTLDNASQARQPIPIKAVADAAPSVVIERPARDVVLPKADPMPIIARAFDDYGIAKLGIQVSARKDDFYTVRWLGSYDQPLTMRLLTTGLDPAAEKLRPGTAVFYRMVVEDRKGQAAYSEAYRLALAAEQEQSTEGVSEQPADLSQLEQMINDLMKLPLDLAEQAGDLLKALPEHMQGESGEQARREMTHPDGTPMTDDEIRQMFEKMDRQLSEQQRQQVDELNRQLDQQQYDAEQLARQLAEAAEQSRQSPQSGPREAEALQNMADRAKELAKQLDLPVKSQGDAGQLERVARAPLNESEQQQVGQMQQQMQRLRESRQNLAADPQKAQQQNEHVIAQQRGQQAASDLDTLRRELDQRQNANQQLREQVQQQQQADESTEPMTDQQKVQTQQQRSELADAAEQQMQADRKLLGEPASPPDDNTNEGAESSLDDVAQQLGEDAEKLGQTNQQATEARGEVGELLQQMSGQSPSDQRDTTSQTTQQSETQQMQQMLDSPRMKKLLAMAERVKGQADDSSQGGSPEGKSQGQTTAQSGQMGKTPEQPGGGGGGSDFSEGDNAGMLSDLVNDPQQRAALHRLPPNLRQPLLQGMQERGPEGYQPLIDAYYRQLTQEAAP
ncbi:DUF4175 domain-containing protein [Planctomycetales bacterium ZRK34]|nr:DUF4175 domain-containing protein [Planctomycetales bacterium ZRK34]